ncbi:MAG: PhzF family phenazine biosynthesis protein [bacterium]
MKTKIYQVDAFTEKIFGGNPAAVCLLNEWLLDELMQKIGLENNLSETAFVVKRDDHFDIRWFTPTVEVDLCGHATQASAHVIFNYTDYKKDVIEFESKSGKLLVRKENDFLILNFPTDKLTEIGIPNDLVEALGDKPVKAFKGRSDHLLVFETQEQIENIKPDFGKLAAADSRGIIITAKGNDCDFVSRFFAPQSGINEDPVTGSAHTTLTPYWSGRFGKTELTAMQLSIRKGHLRCKNLGDRTEIGGKAVTYLIGEIEV